MRRSGRSLWSQSFEPKMVREPSWTLAFATAVYPESVCVCGHYQSRAELLKRNSGCMPWSSRHSTSRMEMAMRNAGSVDERSAGRPNLTICRVQQ
mmetsp:Transcript_34548/g.80620  ORF Transcript_34548/g.80620 Transcript_34548/m.80620 type:complete len:95 (-) Transcript_34548:13-297(-)